MSEGQSRTRWSFCVATGSTSALRTLLIQATARRSFCTLLRQSLFRSTGGDPSCSSKGTGISDFNTEAFISAHDFENTAQLIKYIARVDQDPVLFESYLRQPIFSESWYRRLKDWPAFCSGFKDLLFAECHLGTPRLDPAPPTGQVPYTASGCAKQDGDRCRSVGMPPSDACNHKRNHVNTVLVNFLLLILILPIILCRGDQEMRIDLPL